MNNAKKAATVPMNRINMPAITNTKRQRSARQKPRRCGICSAITDPRTVYNRSIIKFGDQIDQQELQSLRDHRALLLPGDVLIQDAIDTWILKMPSATMAPPIRAPRSTSRMVTTRDKRIAHNAHHHHPAPEQPFRGGSANIV